MKLGHLIFTAAALLSPGAALAQTAPSPTALAAAETSIDPARLAVAQRVVAKLLPPGIYKRMLGDNFVALMKQSVGSVGELSMGEISRIAGLSEAQTKNLGDVKIGQVMAIIDPYWQERIDKTMAAITGAMGDMMSELEPAMRDALARAYARKFGLDELSEFERFFSTPAGKDYADQQFMMFMDPEVTKSMTAAMPSIMKRMPEMMTAAQAAIKDVPPARSYKNMTAEQRRQLATLLGIPEPTLTKRNVR